MIALDEIFSILSWGTMCIEGTGKCRDSKVGFLGSSGHTPLCSFKLMVSHCSQASASSVLLASVYSVLIQTFTTVLRFPPSSVFVPRAPSPHTDSAWSHRRTGGLSPSLGTYFALDLYCIHHTCPWDTCWERENDTVVIEQSCVSWWKYAQVFYQHVPGRTSESSKSWKSLLRGSDEFAEPVAPRQGAMTGDSVPGWEHLRKGWSIVRKQL